jgi:hypothetical protein
LVQAFPKKWWDESDFTAPNLPLPLWLKVLFVEETGVPGEIDRPVANH